MHSGWDRASWGVFVHHEVDSGGVLLCSVCAQVGSDGHGLVRAFSNEFVVGSHIFVYVQMGSHESMFYSFTQKTRDQKQILEVLSGR